MTGDTGMIGPPPKKFEVTLIYLVNEYLVTAISNTTLLKPGERLPVDYVDKLCAHPSWEVRMVDDQMWKNIGMAVLNKVPIPIP